MKTFKVVLQNGDLIDAKADAIAESNGHLRLFVDEELVGIFAPGSWLVIGRKDD